MADWRSLQRQWVVHMAEHDQLRVLEPHVRSAPVRAVFGEAPHAFRRPRWGECRLCREVRFAEVHGIVTTLRKCAGEAFLAHLWVEVDTIVPNAVREREQPCQYRCARRLAHKVGRDAGGKMHAGRSHVIEMGRHDVTINKAETVGAMLVGRYEENVGSRTHEVSPFFDVIAPAIMLIRRWAAPHFLPNLHGSCRPPSPRS